MRKIHQIAKIVSASIAALETPIGFESPIAPQTPLSSKKTRTPEKKESVADAISSDNQAVFDKPTVHPREDLPVHYKRFIDDLRILDETLSIFRTKNQVPFFSRLRDNIERVSGRRFTVDHFRQLMTATDGVLFKADWQPVKDLEGKILKYELVVRAVHAGAEIYRRLSSDQAICRSEVIVNFLNSRLAEYLEKNKENKPENAFPIKPFELVPKPSLEDSSGNTTNPLGSGRTKLLTKCDSVASDGSVVKTPKSSLRRQLSVSASPIVPNALPQFISTPVKVSTPAVSPPKSAKEKLEAIRSRVKAREEEDVKEAKAYDEAMSRKEKVDEFDLSIKYLIKLNHKFPRGIDTAKLSTLKKDYGSMFSDSKDVEKYTIKICELAPDRFELISIGDEKVLRLKTKDVKFSLIKKEIEIQKDRFCEIRE